MISSYKQKKTRGLYTKKACSNCKKGHTACDVNRPCKCCVLLGMESQCVDVEGKRKKEKRKRQEKNNQQIYPSLKEYLLYIPTMYNHQKTPIQFQQIIVNVIRPIQTHINSYQNIGCNDEKCDDSNEKFLFDLFDKPDQ